MTPSKAKSRLERLESDLGGSRRLVVYEAPESTTDEECDAFLRDTTGAQRSPGDLVVRLIRFCGDGGLRLISEQALAGK